MLNVKDLYEMVHSGSTFCSFLNADVDSSNWQVDKSSKVWIKVNNWDNLKTSM